MADVEFYSTTTANYLALETKNNSALYFLDNGQLYKGDMLLSNNCVLIEDGSDYPATGVTNTFYAKSTGECAYWDGNKYVLISRSVMTELEALEDRINETIRLALSNKEIDAVGIIQRTVTSIENDNITNVGICAFDECENLTTVNLPNATEIGDYAFDECDNLTTVNLPNATEIGDYAFQGCRSLTSIDLPNVTIIGELAFGTQNGNMSLSSINLPNVTTIGEFAFQYCTRLTTIDLPNVTSIGRNCFYCANRLETVILSNNCIVSIGGDAFRFTPIADGTGYVYVPDDLIEQYTADSSWSTYKNRIKGLSELP